MLYRPFCFLAPLLLPASAHQILLTAPAPSPFTPSLDKFVAEVLDRWHCPGFAIAVIDGEETFSKGYGIATFPSKPITPHTLFYTASTTKSFTAAAVSLLIDEAANSTSGEALSWDTPLAKLIREDFVLTDDYTTLHATLEDALSHRTGLPRHDFTIRSSNFSVRDIVQNLRHLPMTAEIRTRWQYCNMMFFTVSHFIETWTGVWLGDFLRTRIYEPLGMNHTFFSLEDAQAATASGSAAEVATPYYWTDQTQKYHAIPEYDPRPESGAGATISNVLDYAKWLRCHMTASYPLSTSGHIALHTPRMISSPPMDGSTGMRGADTYALGWEVTNYRGEFMHWHTGSLPGMVSAMIYFPRLQWGVTLMTNGDGGNALLVLIYRMLDDMLGVPDQERSNWELTLALRNAIALETLRNAEDVLHPNAPKGKDKMPLPLPLEAYTGTYTNPGYPPLNLTTGANSTFLHNIEPFHTWPISQTFTHVSASYFLVYARIYSTAPHTDPHDHEVGTDILSKAEFKLNEAGEVAELGVIMEPEMGEKKIWYKKEGLMASGGGYAKTYDDGFSAAYESNNDGASALAGSSLYSGWMRKTLPPLFEKHA